jgi:predicted nucleic acid binding AN1-type Zn finger protein
LLILLKCIGILKLRKVNEPIFEPKSCDYCTSHSFSCSKKLKRFHFYEH